MRARGGLFPAHEPVERNEREFGEEEQQEEHDHFHQNEGDQVTDQLGEIECVARDPSTHSLSDIRLRTRLGMGTCQGTFCSLRTIGALVEHGVPLELSPTDNVRRFLQERWRGLRPALWGTQAREMELGRAVYAGTLNLDGAADEQDN